MLCALCWALLAGLAAPAHAQTISNTAQATWLQSGGPQTTLSNTVSFDVAPVAVTIETFASATSPASLTYTPSRCGGTPILLGNGTAAQQIIAGVSPASQVRIGDAFYFRVTAAAANLDPGRIDMIETMLATSSGDSETIVIYETGPDTGVFVGGVPTAAIPPDARPEDCELSVAKGDRIAIACRQMDDETVMATAGLDVLADPFGYIFDSEDGSAVDGVRVTLIDVASGQPATVFGADGVTRWPSTIITGQPIIDGAGTRHLLPPGEYRFPLAPRGQYRLQIEPPADYTAPSRASPTQLAGVTRPDGSELTLTPASTGGTLTLDSPDLVRIDVPVDRPPRPVTLSKSASRQKAQPGDLVFYTILVSNPDPAHAKRDVRLSDVPDASLRMRPGSLRVDGAVPAGALALAADGSRFDLALGTIPAGGRRKVTYAASVRPDATPGAAQNRVTATDSRGLLAAAGAVVTIEEDGLTARMTLIGRVTEGGCRARGTGAGIPGVRVTLEDGSFAITDVEGRYHFEGLVPGSHVAQVARSTLPPGGHFVDCARSTESAGSATSRFIRGQGGSLVVADFIARLPAGPRPAAAANLPGGAPEPATDKAAAGAEIDWLAQGDGPPAFLFPAPEHNPRAPSVRVAIRHRADQKVELSADGKPVDPVAFDGLKLDPTRSQAVSLWRGVPLAGETTLLRALVRNADGSIAADLERPVNFIETPADVQLLPDRSRLVADGRTRPVLALRLVDRQGRPVHAGLSGQFQLSAPYEMADAADAQQTRALSGAAGQAPHWTVKGDDGIAYVELAPTMVSGSLQLDFVFPDGQQQQPRRRSLKGWIVPGDIRWTLVGLAEGSAGAQSIADAMERSGRLSSDLGQQARVAFYAKGRLRGSTLLTLAYDSAKQKADQRLQGAIDPRAYYTIYADGSARRFDAASRDRLYVRLEARAFYAMLGDFETGFAQTQLARYSRVATGLKTEFDNGRVHAAAFATRVAARHRRLELQGAGITGPYRLGNGAIIANSEIVVIEVRDRFRSELVLERRTLSRFLDYDVDLLAGTLTFKQPILSRDSALNPQFIVVDYDVDPGLTAQGALNAGLRADWTTRDGRLRIGGTGLTDKGDADRTDLAAVDIRYRPDGQTELRAETALSQKAGSTASAWLVEAERRNGRLSLVAYARSADAAFGLGQLNGAETGRRKLGADARLALGSALAVSASAWTDRSLIDGARRKALRLRGEYRTRPADAWIGASAMQDNLADGTAPSSVLLEAGVGRRLMAGRLQIDAATGFGIGGTSVADLPARHQISAGFAVTPWLKLLGTYEIAQGKSLGARTARAGFEVQPWQGGRLTTTLGRQNLSEEGRRSFAAFGLAQAWPVNSRLSVDATLDANRILAGSAPAQPINPAQPLASGGHLGGNGTLVEQFTALSLGASWRAERWTLTARGEWRSGEVARRRGLTLGALRQLGEGRMVGAGLTWTRALGADGSTSELIDSAIALAWRPARSRVAVLSRLELRADVAGAPTRNVDTTRLALGDLFAAGSAGRSRRLIASVSANWTPLRGADENSVQRLEIGLFSAVRAKLDGFDDQRVAGTTLLTGFDLRVGIGPRVSVGGSATLRSNAADGSTQIAVGPQVSVSPANNTVLTLGYTFAGYRDRDFAEARATRQGVFAALKLKFDADSLGFLGIGRR